MNPPDANTVSSQATEGPDTVVALPCFNRGGRGEGSVAAGPEAPGTWRTRAVRLFRSLGDLIWPPVCATCSRALPLVDDPLDPAGHFCPECLASVEFMPPAVCRICGRPFYQATEHVCGQCLATPPPYQTARSAVVYHGSVARSIARLKYAGDLSQVAVLAGLAGRVLGPPRIPGGVDVEPTGRALNLFSDDQFQPGRFSAEPAPVLGYDAIVPLPISGRRLVQRGFNQAAELARALYRPWRHLLDERLLSRPADGDLHQAALGGDQRRQAIRGCFHVPAPPAVKGLRLLLFDDVLTTGATAGEAAATLLSAGALRVDVVTIARTVLQSWR